MERIDFREFFPRRVIDCREIKPFQVKYWHFAGHCVCNFTSLWHSHKKYTLFPDSCKIKLKLLLGIDGRRPHMCTDFQAKGKGKV